MIYSQLARQQTRPKHPTAACPGPHHPYSHLATERHDLSVLQLQHVRGWWCMGKELRQPGKRQTNQHRSHRRSSSVHRSLKSAYRAATRLRGDVVVHDRTGQLVVTKRMRLHEVAVPDTSAQGSVETTTAGWAAIRKLIGSVSGPRDFAAETDHYAHDTPKTGQ